MILIEETSARWTSHKEELLSQTPGSFAVHAEIGHQLADHQNWFAAVEGSEVLGYGWIDRKNEDFELSVATDQRLKIPRLGSAILAALENEAIQLGAIQVIAIISATHPNKRKALDWLQNNGYAFENELETQPIDTQGALELSKHVFVRQD